MQMLSRGGNVATLPSAADANRDVRTRAVVIVNVMTRRHGSKVREKQPEVMVVGAGIADLTAAALPAKNGGRVQLLERHAARAVAGAGAGLLKPRRVFLPTAR
jgi:ribulose 1,5-bisphosphate synthetase/thiazole synthase